MLTDFLIPSGASSPKQGSLPHPHKCQKCQDAFFPYLLVFLVHTTRCYGYRDVRLIQLQQVMGYLILTFFDAIFVPEE